MKKTMILLGFLALAPFAKGQLLLEVLDAPSAFTSTQTRSYTGTFTKNDCSGAYDRGTDVTYTQNATATATSYISQQDADNKAANEATAEAQRLVNQGGQKYANGNGKCEFIVTNAGCALVGFKTDNDGKKSVVFGAALGYFSLFDCLRQCEEVSSRLEIDMKERGYDFDEIRCVRGQTLLR